MTFSTPLLFALELEDERHPWEAVAGAELVGEILFVGLLNEVRIVDEKGEGRRFGHHLGRIVDA